MNDARDGYTIIMKWLLTLVISIGIGITAWRWLEPENALEYFSFLLGWMLLSTSGHYISRIIVALIRRIT